MPKPFEPALTLDEIRKAFPNFNSFELLKSGGEGTVVKAINEKTKNTIALKIYSPNHLQVRSELEAKKLLKIDNPCLIRLYNYNKITLRGMSCYYTETSYIDGDDLQTLCKNNYKFSLEEVIKVIVCISSCIEDLWHEKVVHCDIKPANIIKSGDSYILVDLGIAKYLDASTLTATGMIMGTMGYLAPEQFNGRKNLTLKADYYALGITVYELLTGYHPFNYDQIAMLKSPVPTLPMQIQVPHQLKSLLSRMLDPVPFKRPMNHSDILESLKEVL